MSVTFTLPDVGEGVAEAEIVRWLVKPGNSSKPINRWWKCRRTRQWWNCPHPLPVGWPKSTGKKET